MADQKKHKKQRDFERFPLDFLVEVTGLSQSGKAFSDRGKMKDVSGSGLCFFTAHSDWYSEGQKVVIGMVMDGCMSFETRRLPGGSSCPEDPSA